MTQPTVVQSTGAQSFGGVASASKSITGVTAGNAVLCLAALADPTTTRNKTAVPTPSGGWSVAIAPTGPDNTNAYMPQLAVFYKLNASSGTHTADFTTLPAGSFIALDLVELSALPTSGALDVTASAISPTNTTVSSGTVTTATTTRADGIAIAMGGVGGASGASAMSSPPTTGYTSLAIDTTAYSFGYKLLSALGTQSGGFTWTGSSDFQGVLAVFKGVLATLSASAAQTLAGVGQSATGAVTRGAVAAQTLAGVTQAATGAVTRGASAAQTLANVTQAATIGAVDKASAAQTLAGVAQAATAGVGTSAAGAQALANITQAATAATAVSAAAAQTLGAVAQAATGTVSAAESARWNSTLGSNLTRSDSGAYVNTRVTKTAGASYSSAVSNIGWSSGKRYFELYLEANYSGATYVVLGVAKAGVPLTAYIGSTADGWGYYEATGEKVNNGSLAAFGGSFSEGKTIGVAVDLDAGYVWFSRDGVWQGSGNPATGANPAFTGLSGPIFAAASLYNGDTSPADAVLGRFAEAAMAYPIPAGFDDWADTESPISVAGAQTLANVAQAATAAIPLSIPGSLTTPALSEFGLLLHGEGANGGTTITDSSPNGFTPTIFGNVQTSTAGSRYGATSLGFDGSGDALVYAPTTQHNLTSGDGTISLWVFPVDAGAGIRVLLNRGGGIFIGWASYQIIQNGLDVYFSGSSNNAGYDIGQEVGPGGWMGTLIPFQWNHIALTKSGTTYRGFVRGTKGYQETTSLVPYNSSSYGLAIGANFANNWATGTPVASFYGFMDELAFIHGTAVWTADFTPPSQAWHESPAVIAQLLANVTQSATAILATGLLGSQQLADVAQVATAAARVAGVAAQVLGNVTQSAAGALVAALAAAQTLANVAQTATGSAPFSLAAAQILANITQVATGSTTVADRSAAAAQTLASIAQLATLTVRVSASAAQTLAPVAQAAGAFMRRDFAAAQALQDVIQAAQAHLVAQMTGSTLLSDLAQAATARALVKLSGAQVLASVQQTAGSTVAETFHYLSGAQLLANVIQNARAALNFEFIRSKRTLKLDVHDRVLVLPAHNRVLRISEDGRTLIPED